MKITLLSTVSPLQLPNFVSCGRDKPSHMTQNLVTVGTKLWTAERFLVDPWSMDQADLVWYGWHVLSPENLKEAVIKWILVLIFVAHEIRYWQPNGTGIMTSKHKSQVNSTKSIYFVTKWSQTIMSWWFFISIFMKDLYEVHGDKCIIALVSWH